MVWRSLLAIAFVAAITSIPAGSAYAQCGGPPGPPNPPTAGPPPKGLCVYSVKFVCGLQPPNTSLVPPSEPPVKPGNYATAVNIHNFHNGQSVPIAKKAVIANTEDQQAGTISAFHALTLGPDQALEIDCPDIAGLVGNSVAPLPSFIKGFVEVVSRVPLSVTGVYTAQACEITTAGSACQPTGPVSIDVVPEQAFAGP